MHLALYSLLTETAVIREVRIEGLDVGAQRLADRSFTFEHVVEPAELAKLLEPKLPKPKSSLTSFLLDRHLHVSAISLNDIDLRFGDASVDGGWSAALEGFFLQLNGARVNLQDPLEVSFERFEVGFAGVEIAQPPGHTGEPFAQVDGLHLQVGAWQGFTDTVVLEDLAVDSFAALLTRHNEESTSVEDLVAYSQALAEDAQLRLQALLENPMTGATGAISCCGSGRRSGTPD